MDNNYSGWNLFDDVVLITRNKNDGIYEQAYLVNPKDKKQLENAKWWAGKDFTEYTFENKDFELELLDSAGNSSQGGKLSFWNCLIYKDDKIFKIGISSHLLLLLLKESTFINGKCSQKVCFARFNGGVGVLHKEMKAYKQAVEDMNIKEKMKKKTSKHIIGHNYVTLQHNEVYLGDFYQWYEPIYKENPYNSWSQRYELIAIQKLKSPKKYKMLKRVETEKTFLSIKDYMNDLRDNWPWREELLIKLPARTEGNLILKNDVSSDDWEKCFMDNRNENIYKIEEDWVVELTSKHSLYSKDDEGKKRFYKNKINYLFSREHHPNFLGQQWFMLSANGNKAYDFSESIKNIFKFANIKILNENGEEI